jgi:hypothetical protein
MKKQVVPFLMLSTYINGCIPAFTDLKQQHLHSALIVSTDYVLSGEQDVTHFD